MEIDILEYELKYKHNEPIINLVRAYKNAEDESAAMEELSNEAEDRADAAESRADGLNDVIENINEEVREIVSILNGAKNGKKSEMIDDIETVINRLEGIAYD